MRLTADIASPTDRWTPPTNHPAGTFGGPQQRTGSFTIYHLNGTQFPLAKTTWVILRPAPPKSDGAILYEKRLGGEVRAIVVHPSDVPMYVSPA